MRIPQIVAQSFWCDAQIAWVLGFSALFAGGKSLKPKRRKKAKKQIPEELLTETLGVDAQTDGGRDKGMVEKTSKLLLP